MRALSSKMQRTQKSFLLKPSSSSFSRRQASAEWRKAQPGTAGIRSRIVLSVGGCPADGEVSSGMHSLSLAKAMGIGPLTIPLTPPSVGTGKTLSDIANVPSTRTSQH